MNKMYVFTADSFEGEVIFEFSDSNILVCYDLKAAKLNAEQQFFILQNLPKQPADLPLLVQKTRSGKIEEMVIDFEKFWQRYNDTINSSKKKTGIKWNNMKPGEQMKAFNYIGRYFASIPSGTRKKYAETYLNSELWNN